MLRVKVDHPRPGPEWDLRDLRERTGSTTSIISAVAIDGVGSERLPAEVPPAPRGGALVNLLRDDSPIARRRQRAQDERDVQPATAMSAPPRTGGDREQIATAVVYCEANFGAVDGKTAHGLVRHSEKYQILSVIDSQKVGLDAGVVLGEIPTASPSSATWPRHWPTPEAYPTPSSSGWRRRAACCRAMSAASCSRPSPSE